MNRHKRPYSKWPNHKDFVRLPTKLSTKNPPITMLKLLAAASVEGNPGCVATLRRHRYLTYVYLSNKKPPPLLSLPLAYSLTRLLAYSLTRLLTHSLIHSLIHLLTQSLFSNQSPRILYSCIQSIRIKKGSGLQNYIMIPDNFSSQLQQKCSYPVRNFANGWISYWTTCYC